MIQVPLTIEGDKTVLYSPFKYVSTRFQL